MITVYTNFDEIISGITGKLQSIDMNRICMIQATYIAGAWRTRIHKEGKSADGSQIGIYSPGYMKVRTGDFGNRAVKKTGKNKGKAKENDAGVFTRGRNKGQTRPRYNRTQDSTVILSLTRCIEDSMTAIQIENGAGVGWHDELNFNKSHWLEKKYGKKIYALTDEESKTVKEIAENEIARILS